jgi:DNA-directed RNA polymerase specialized sigma24 family protein
VASTLTQPSFDALLVRLDPDRDRAGLAYEQLRKRLVRYFEWQSCTMPDDRADTVFSRLAHRIEQGEPIVSVHAYAMGIARLVVREAVTEQYRQASIAAQSAAVDVHVEDEPDVRLPCLDTCLSRLMERSRKLILDYYEFQGRAKIERREAMARDLGITGLALRGRVHRIKAGLETCVLTCLDRERAGQPKHS